MNNDVRCTCTEEQICEWHDPFCGWECPQCGCLHSPAYWSEDNCCAEESDNVGDEYNTSPGLKRSLYDKWMDSECSSQGYPPVVEVEYPNDENRFKLLCLHQFPNQAGVIINFGWRKGDHYVHSHSISV